VAGGTDPDADAVAFLLRSDEPAVRYLARRDLLGEDGSADRAAITSGPKVSALLSGQQPDRFRGGPGWRGWPGAQFGFGVHPYRKWTGAHWRLLSLVDLAVPAGEERARLAAEQVLGWLSRPERLRSVRVIDGLVRHCASQDGNAVGVCCRLGLATDERVATLADALVNWQWPDGGWNCDVRARGHRSSFHESLGPLWGLHEYAAATGDRQAAQARDRAAELFLAHRLFRATATGEPVSPTWLRLRYPAYWHYDVLAGARVLVQIGRASDRRLDDARQLLRERRRPDGSWGVDGCWWKPPGAGRDAHRGQRAWNAEVVDWGRSGPNEMVTLHALRVLRAA
jgi:hypothetical protein